MSFSDSILLNSSRYILVCGSYQKNRANRMNDKLCDYLGVELAKHDIKIISAGGSPAIRIVESMAGTMDELNSYDSSKILTVYRRKPKGGGNKYKESWNDSI